MLQACEVEGNVKGVERKGSEHRNVERVQQGRAAVERNAKRI